MANCCVSKMRFMLNSCTVLYFFTGVAIMMMWMPALVCVATYFHKRKAFAFSLTSIGFASGFIIWAPLFRAMVTHYGRKGALLIYAGIALNGLIAAAVLRPVKKQVKKDAPLEKNKEYKEMKKHQNCYQKVSSHISFLKDIKGYLFIVSYTAVIVGHIVPYYFLPARVVSMGDSREKGALLLSILGATGLVGR